MNEVFQSHRECAARSIERQPICCTQARFAVLFAMLLGAAGAWPAEKEPERLEEIVVQAKRQADQQVTRQVEKTLEADPWIFSEHITVRTENGVVHLEGIVGDTGEWFRILRLARKIPGARRVVSELEIMHNDPDGG